MSWNGKLTGGILGLLFFGPVGALVGLFLGHLWDQVGGGRSRGASFRFGSPDRTVFFNTTFAVMGHLSKVDGRVSQEEIEVAEQVMAQLGMNAERRREARAMFNLGKAPDFDLADALSAFQAAYGGAAQLKMLFLHIQMSAAWADGAVGRAEQEVLHEIARRLRIPAAAYRQVEAIVAGMSSRARYGHEDGHRTGPRGASSQAELQGAYRALGVSASDSDAVIKRAYRRLISKHHPDKLVSKGLPEDMMRVATQRTAEIKTSYDLIMANRANAG